MEIEELTELVRIAGEKDLIVTPADEAELQAAIKRATTINLQDVVQQMESHDLAESAKPTLTFSNLEVYIHDYGSLFSTN